MHIIQLLTNLPIKTLNTHKVLSGNIPNFVNTRGAQIETEQEKEKRGKVQQIPVLLSSQPKLNLLCTEHETCYCTAQRVKSPHSGTVHLLKLAVKSVDSCKSVVPSANRKPVFIFLAQEYGEFHMQIKHLEAKEKNPAKGVTFK